MCRMDSRHRVEECTVIDRPLKMSKVGQTMVSYIYEEAFNLDDDEL